jgi:hypothetical protein
MENLMKTSSNTDWFRDAGWGVMLHYLSRPPHMTFDDEPFVEEWNRRVDNFNVDKLANQLAELQAGYLLITIGQNSGFYLAPNFVYDSIVEYEPSRCSQRDLIKDLAEALSHKKIKLMLYLTSHPPAKDIRALEAFKCTPDWKDREPKWAGLKKSFYKVAEGVDERLSECQWKWSDVIKEWSFRYGETVSGWWVDGCQHADLMYEHPDEPNFKTMADAFRAGNPQSILAFASGRNGVHSISEYEDYTAGEMGSYLNVPFKDRLSRWVDGKQYHILTFTGEDWGYGEPRFTKDFIAAYTRELNLHQAVITWDVPPSEDGTIDDVFMDNLSDITAKLS